MGWIQSDSIPKNSGPSPSPIRFWQNSSTALAIARQIAEGLQALNLHAIPSVANFIAFDCGRPAQPLYEALLHEGVIVRPIGGYGMPNHLRVSIGLGEQNDRFLKALAKVLGQ